MSVTEALWVFAPLVSAVVALLLFARKRRRTADYAKGRAFKAALPWWVGTIERLVALACASVFAVGAWKVCVVLAGPPSPDPITSPGPFYVIVGIGAIILPLALLCANVVSWIVPPLRSANERAFRGNGASFRSLNQGLIKGALASASAGLILIGVAAIKPWSG
jgi:hypothetical protein